MNSKGFTLLELIATIIILSLVLIIAVPSVSNMSKSIRKKDRENNIKSIEIAASKYAFDTGETLIFVDKLVTEGYIESDEEGNIKDSLNNSRLNCYIVEMEKVSDYYSAKFIDDKNYELNGECDTSKLNEINSGVYIQANVDGKPIEEGEWVSGIVNLTALSSNDDEVQVDCSIHSCIWTSSSGTDIKGESTITIDNFNNTIKTRYNFQLRIEDENNGLKIYNSSVNLKIDNEAPYIRENEIDITDRFDSSKPKTVTIVASDNSGSGIASYYLVSKTKSSCLNSDLVCCLNTELSYQSSNVFTKDSNGENVINGEYLICVKDNVGNVSAKSLTIGTID